MKVLDHSGSGYWSWVVCRIDWCTGNDVEVLSMSLGADEMADEVHTAIEDAYAAGHLLVSSAGDDGHDDPCSDGTVGQPARHPDTVAVSALDPDDALAGYSSVGVTGPEPGTRDEVEQALFDEAEDLGLCENAQGDGLVQVDQAVGTVTD